MPAGIKDNDLISEVKKRRTRLLAVDDNAINQNVTLNILSKFGFTADAVYNGKEAVKALEMAAYDLVLMDVHMPEMDGYEATQAIRNPESDVKNRKVPSIAMTAYAMTSDRDLCLNAGMDDYISKPVDPQNLLETIERYLFSS